MFMTKTFRYAALAGVALLAVSGSAAIAADPASVQAGTYALESSHARVAFAVDHMGFSTWYGDFTGAKGSLTLDPKNVAGSKLDITIPTGSITTTNAVLDGELKDPSWFDAAKYPTITFRSTSVAATGADSAKVTGDLTFHGVTKPVTLDVKFHGAGANPMSKAYTVGFDATGSLKRSDFGVTKYVPLIGDKVDLFISAPFEKK
jgi:polyisoprenoid-binding protein YceI